MATIPLRFPAAGMYRVLAQQRQDPFTTPDCQNVRPFDSIAGRARGGLRPGMVGYPFPIFDSGKPINLLTCLTVAGTPSIEDQVFVDDFRDGLNDDLWITITNTNEIVGQGVTIAPVVDSTYVRFRRELAVNPSLPYRMTMKLSSTVSPDQPDWRYFVGSAFIDFGLEDQGEFFDGPWFRVSVHGTAQINTRTQTFEVTLEQMQGPDVFRTFFAATTTRPLPGQPPVTLGSHDIELSVSVDSGQARVLFEIGPLSTRIYRIESELFDIGGTASGIVGFTLKREFPGTAFGAPVANAFQLNSSSLTGPAAFPNPDCLLLAASDGEIKFSTGTGTTRTPTDKLDQRVRPIMAVDGIAQPNEDEGRVAGQKLFIADYTDDLSTFPKYYDPDSNQLRAWFADPGGANVPTGNHIIAKFLGRTYLAGNPPHAFQASAINDPFDWHFDGTDPSTALVEDLGGSSLGAPIRGMAPHTKDFMLMWTANETWRLSGDLRDGGSFNSISKQAGLAGPFAWTMTPDGSIVWLDQERGLFKIDPGARGYPIPISDNRLPRELKNIDPTVVNVTVLYDHIGVGIHIILASPQGREHWWYDWRLKGFWRDEIHADRQMLTAFDFQSGRPHESGLLLGGTDGVLRRFSDRASSDDGKEIENFIVYGPFVLAGRDHIEGSIEWIRATTAPSGTPVDWEVFTSSNAEDALSGRRRRERSGSFGASVNDPRVDPDFSLDMQRHEVRRAGVVGLIKLRGVSNQPWAVESLDMDVVTLQEAHT